jgi:hypothetical protein
MSINGLENHRIAYFGRAAESDGSEPLAVPGSATAHRGENALTGRRSIDLPIALAGHHLRRGSASCE